MITKKEFRQMMIEQTNYYGTELDEENNWLEYYKHYRRDVDRVNKEIEEEREIKKLFCGEMD